jgi:hypothetical protein
MSYIYPDVRHLEIRREPVSARCRVAAVLAWVTA